MAVRGWLRTPSVRSASGVSVLESHSLAKFPSSVTKRLPPGENTACAVSRCPLSVSSTPPDSTSRTIISPFKVEVSSFDWAIPPGQPTRDALLESERRRSLAPERPELERRKGRHRMSGSRRQAHSSVGLKHMSNLVVVGFDDH